MMLDSHQHFWHRADARFDYSWQDAPSMRPIRRDFMPVDMEPLIGAAGIDQTIVVQTQHHLAENDWALELAERYAFIAGVVGWVDLTSDPCESQLLAAGENPKFVGIRHITQDEPDDDFIVRDDVMRGLKVLEKHSVPFDLLFFVRQLRHAATLGRALPDLPMVIDHLAKPQIKDRRIDNWLTHFQAAAACPNIYCKLSGMITEADWQRWTPDDLRVYVQHALDLFGPERLMFGSDWPVCTLAGSYAQVIEALNEALGPIGDNERAKIFDQTARRFYGLK